MQINAHFKKNEIIAFTLTTRRKEDERRKKENFCFINSIDFFATFLRLSTIDDTKIK